MLTDYPVKILANLLYNGFKYGFRAHHTSKTLKSVLQDPNLAWKNHE